METVLGQPKSVGNADSQLFGLIGEPAVTEEPNGTPSSFRLASELFNLVHRQGADGRAEAESGSCICGDDKGEPLTGHVGIG